jgi:hypothetical protein
MKLYPTHIILEYIDFLRANLCEPLHKIILNTYNSQELTLMKLYLTHIILEYIEFSRVNLHKALPYTHNS